MTEVNLLPPELRRRQRSRQVTLQFVALAAAVVLALLVLFVFESSRLASTNRELDAQTARNQALQNDVTQLQRFADLKDQLSQRQALVAGLERATVQWSGVLHDLSMVIPGDVYVTSLTGSITVSSADASTEASPTGIIGSLQFGGQALDHPDVALWLERLAQVNGWVNAWVSSENKASAETGQTSVQFTGTVDLDQSAAQDVTTP
jgi:Tfp pilus assembly protein PilN